MRTPTWSAVATSLVLLVPVACGSDRAPDAAVRTPAELGAALLVPGDLTGAWTVNTGGPDDPAPADGIITDAVRPMLPTLEFCAAASPASVTAAAQLRWTAYRQLDMTEADPIDLPNDRTGHLAFVQEFLVSTDAPAALATFGALRDGMAACLGPIPAGEEGPGVATALTVPPVGDERYGVLTTLQEAGGGAEWLFHQILVVDGPVLLTVHVVDVRIDAEPLFGTADVDAIVRAAVDKL